MSYFSTFDPLCPEDEQEGDCGDCNSRYDARGGGACNCPQTERVRLVIVERGPIEGTYLARHDGGTAERVRCAAELLPGCPYDGTLARYRDLGAVFTPDAISEW